MADRMQRVLDQLERPTPIAPPPAFIGGVRRIRRRRRVTIAATLVGSLGVLALSVALLRPLLTEHAAPLPRAVATTAPTTTTAGAMSLRGTSMDGATIPLSGETRGGSRGEQLTARDAIRILNDSSFIPR